MYFFSIACRKLTPAAILDKKMSHSKLHAPQWPWLRDNSVAVAFLGVCFSLRKGAAGYVGAASSLLTCAALSVWLRGWAALWCLLITTAVAEAASHILHPCHARPASSCGGRLLRLLAASQPLDGTGQSRAFPCVSLVQLAAALSAATLLPRVAAPAAEPELLRVAALLGLALAAAGHVAALLLASAHSLLQLALSAALGAACVQLLALAARLLPASGVPMALHVLSLSVAAALALAVIGSRIEAAAAGAGDDEDCAFDGRGAAALARTAAVFHLPSRLSSSPSRSSSSHHLCRPPHRQGARRRQAGRARRHPGPRLSGSACGITRRRQRGQGRGCADGIDAPRAHGRRQPQAPPEAAGEQQQQRHCRCRHPPRHLNRHLAAAALMMSAPAALRSARRAPSRLHTIGYTGAVSWSA